MAHQHTVQVGDTLSGIAKRYGVDQSLVTGFRSGDPNLIYPGENLTIGTPGPGPTIEDNNALVPPPTGPGVTSPSTLPTNPQNPANPASLPQNPVNPSNPPQEPQEGDYVAGKGVLLPDGTYKPTQAGDTGSVNPVSPTTPEEPEVRTFTTPSGAVVDEKGEIVERPVQAGLDEIFQDLADTDPESADAIMDALGYSTAPKEIVSKYGLSSEGLEQGFRVNPTGTITDLIQQVTQMTGLPDARANIENITKQIEDLQNEQDSEIQKINDNPFTSASTKKQLIEQVTDKYEKRIDHRTNRLTLLQNAYQQARQESQFAITTAIGLYDKERTFDQREMENYLNRIEKSQAAQDKLSFELSPGQVRYKLNPKTGQYEAVASLPSASGELGGLTKDERTYLNQIQDNARQDQNVKEFPAIRASFETARSAAVKRNGAGDIVLMRMIAKITDPTTGVKEEEFRTFETAQSTLARYSITLTKKMWEGDRLNDSGRLSLYQQAKDIYQQRLDAYQNSYDFFNKQAVDAGLPDGLVMPQYTAPSMKKDARESGGWF